MGDKQIYGSELNNIYNKYKFALNICQDRFGFSVRVQQCLSSGCVLFSETCNDFKEMNFIPKNLVLFDDLDDFITKWKKAQPKERG